MSRARYPFSSPRPADLGMVPPYYVPSQCYDQPTDDHPEKGGFRTELQGAQAACDACRAKLGQASPGPYCQGVRDACQMWGDIPPGSDPSKLTPQQIDECVARCKSDVAQALVRNFCDEAHVSKDPAAAGDAGAGGGAGAAPKKSSALPWVAGGLALMATGVALIVYGRGLPPSGGYQSNPASRGRSRRPPPAPILYSDGSFDVYDPKARRYRRFWGRIPEGYGLTGHEWDAIGDHLKEHSGRKFRVVDQPQAGEFTLEQFAFDNQGIDEVFEEMAGMRVGQQIHVDLGAGGAFGLVRIS